MTRWWLSLTLAVGAWAQGNTPEVAGPKDVYGGELALTGTATGWFHVERFGRRWLLVTPAGHGFFSLGVTHSEECLKPDALNLFETRYGASEPRLAEFLLEQFRSWGYNSAGYGSLPTIEQQMPYVATVWTEGPRSFSAGDRSTNTDLYDPQVQERLRSRVRSAAQRHREKPLCLGYVFTDLPVWSVVPQRGPSYVDFLRGLATAAPGRRAYLEFLRQRHGADLPALCTSYGLPATTWEALATADLTVVDARRPAVAVDDEAFLNRLADHYYRLVVTTLRAADPHHLIFGDRLMSLPQWTPDSIVATVAQHVDLLAFQPLGTNTLHRGYLDDLLLRHGKPVLFADTNTMRSRPQQGQTETTEYERAAGEHTWNWYLDAAASPACVGIHRCTVRDYQPWNPQFHRRGLLRADDSPYPLLVDYTQRTNREVYRLVYQDARQP